MIRQPTSKASAARPACRATPPRESLRRNRSTSLQLDLHLLDSPLEDDRRLVFLRYGGDDIHPDVEWLHAVTERHGFIHAPFASLLTVDIELDGRRFPRARLDRSKL